MATAREIINSAARKINVLGVGQTLQAEDIQNGLEVLNDILGSWSVEGGMVYTQTTETFPLDGSVSYTIGDGGDFDTVRPSYIRSVYVTQGSTDYTLNSVDQDGYSAIATKQTQGLPNTYYYDGNYPLANLYIYPVGSAIYTLTINSVKPLTQFASVNATYDLPPEYRRALVHNLALEWAPEWEKEASTTVKKIANQGKKLVLASNTRNDEYLMNLDNAVVGVGSFNILTGEYN